MSLVLHLVTAWFSRGYHSADEYFQILEFLNYKLGGTPMKDLAVEFPERMRPWLQPFLYFGWVKLWATLGIKSPFFWAFTLRLFTGLVGWISLVALSLRARDWFETERVWRFSVKAAALLWFLPSLHARPSSENLAGSFFLIGLALADWLAQPRPPTEKVLGGATAAHWGLPWLASGAIVGLAFEARFQMGVAIAGLGAWLLFRARVRWGRLAWWLAGFAVIFAVGRWIDRWGYGEWVLSPWNYVKYNLLRGEVNRFGQAPWWDVFRMSFTESWPFIGLALAAATIVAWVRHPFHVLTWSLVPFFLIHEAIPHKELRFFFPIALAGPWLLTLALVSRRHARFTDPDRVPLVRWVWRFFVFNNAVALGALTFLPYARTAQFYEGVAELIPPDAERFEILYQGRDPYLVLGNPIYFYRPANLVTEPFDNYDALAVRLHANPAGQPLWVFSQRFELPPEALRLAPYCVPAYRTLPEWVQYINYGDWLSRANAWTLFRCTR
jgi:phosphatidylinositol glycan class B